MVDPNRLIVPQDRFHEGFPDLDFREVYSCQTSGEALLVTDPTYLADVYNSKDETAAYLRANGVFLMDFGGDSSCPVWWQVPYLMLPLSLHLDWDDLRVPAGVTVLADEVGCDSGSFLFLPLSSSLPAGLEDEIDGVIKSRAGAAISVPAGKWSFYYEQWELSPDKPDQRMIPFYRNIVARWEPTDN